MILQHLIDQEIEKFKTEQLKRTTEQFAVKNESEPHLSILSYDHPSKTFGQVNLPVGVAFDTPATKATFFQIAIPQLFKFHNENFKQIICISIAVEAWLWMAEAPKNGTKVDFDEIKKGDKREVLMVSFEWATDGEINHFPISRASHKVKLGDPEVFSSSTNVQLRGSIPELFKRYNQSRNK